MRLDFIELLSAIVGALVVGLIVFVLLFFYFEEILPYKRFRKKMQELEKIKEKLEKRMFK